MFSWTSYYMMLHPLVFDLYFGFFIVYQFPLLVAKIFVLCHILWLPTHQTLTCYCNILEPIHFCGSCCLLVILAIGLVSLLFFVTEENYKYQSGLRTRELGQAPILLVFLTPRQALSSHPRVF